MSNEKQTSDKHFEQDDYCNKCGSSTCWEDCWSCGGEGGRGYDDDLQYEDPLWYSPGDWEECTECHGAGGFEICMNKECVGE